MEELLPILILCIGIPLLAEWRMRRAFKKCKETSATSGLTGAQVAEAILRDAGITNVTVCRGGVDLSDHFDPKRRIIKLSKSVHDGTHIAAIAIAAHEAGHAIQQQESTSIWRIRMGVVNWAVLAESLSTLLVGIGALSGDSDFFTASLLPLLLVFFFELITLPVEFDASRRAHEKLLALNITTPSESAAVRRMLRWAAFTYVAAAITTLIGIIRWILDLLDL